MENDFSAVPRPLWTVLCPSSAPCFLSSKIFRLWDIRLLKSSASDLQPQKSSASDLQPLRSSASDLQPQISSASDLHPLSSSASRISRFWNGNKSINFKNTFSIKFLSFLRKFTGFSRKIEQHYHQSKKKFFFCLNFLSIHPFLGDPIYHVWECPTNAFAMLIHSCVVYDGQTGTQVPVIDENG